MVYLAVCLQFNLSPAVNGFVNNSYQKIRSTLGEVDLNPTKS